MSITSFSSPGRRAAIAAALLSGSMAFLGAAASAAPVLRGGPAVPTAAPAAPAAALVTISGHVPDLVRTSTPLGVLPAGEVLNCSVTLPLRNQAALDDLLHGLSDPTDARYGQYLTPSEFGDQFGPSRISYSALISYLQSKGLTVTQTFPSRTYVSLSGTASQINAAFGVTLKQFQSPSGRIFRAPDTEVKVPATVAGLISGVTGLDNATPPVPLLHQMKPRRVSSAKAIVPVSGGSTNPDYQNPGEQGTGPGGGFAPSDIHTAYGLNGTALDGTGQTTAIIEYGTEYNIKDALKYEATFGLKRVPITIVPVDGGPTVFEADGPAETNLDIASQLSMAPNISIRLYLQGSTGSTTDAIYAVATDNIAKQLSISYGFGAESRTATTPSAAQIAVNAAYTQLAAQGISVYVSAGDSGSQADSSGRTSVDTSSSAPMVCGVGGTTLVVQSAGVNENYKLESTWNDATTSAGGGGISKQWAIPSYQINAANFSAAISGSNVSVTNRNVPDISAVADPDTGITLYVSEDPGLSGSGYYIFGGTSESAPLWAGFTALVNQNRALALPTGGPLGFPNYSLYPLAYSSVGLQTGYTSVFHDINDLSSNLAVSGGTNFAAVKGYDDSTGLGSMQGVPLITALSQGILVK